MFVANEIVIRIKYCEKSYNIKCRYYFLLDWIIGLLNIKIIIVNGNLVNK